jgi:putative transposase
MANTYSQIYIQIVFAVAGRMNLIEKKWKDELYKYISGIIRNNDQKLIAIGGTENHIHILIGIKPTIALSDLVRDVKANSSRFVNEKKFAQGKFSWQQGFGAFSYSHSHLSDVIRYIQHQEEHHKTKNFKDEYLKFLKKYEVDYDEKYLFDFE